MKRQVELSQVDQKAMEEEARARDIARRREAERERREKVSSVVMMRIDCCVELS
jgi:hypothetical protein